MYKIFIATIRKLTSFFYPSLYLWHIINLYSLILWKGSNDIIWESGWRFVAFRSSASVTCCNE